MLFSISWEMISWWCYQSSTNTPDAEYCSFSRIKCFLSKEHSIVNRGLLGCHVSHFCCWDSVMWQMWVCLSLQGSRVPAVEEPAQHACLLGVPVQLRVAGEGRHLQSWQHPTAGGCVGLPQKSVSLESSKNSLFLVCLKSATCAKFCHLW